MTARPRLGKGLSALLGEYADDLEPSVADARQLAVDRVSSNPFQPRREFPDEQFEELKESIRENGLLQPLVVRPAGAGWELVAGERRLRAVRSLGWSEVLAVIRELDDRAMLVLAMVENVQRENLSPLEEAAGYQRLTAEFGLTQHEVAESVGRDRSTVANLLRLLQLPLSVQRLVDAKALSMGHARALLGLGSKREMAGLAREAAEGGWSVRTVEERVRRRRGGAPARPSQARTGGGGTPHLRRIEEELQRSFGTRVRIRLSGPERGKVEVPFRDAEDFERVMALLGVES
ncbi:MAG: ParB/RepB/Spo0J family partition protein [Longimicrobiaceae bacterium]